MIIHAGNAVSRTVAIMRIRGFTLVELMVILVVVGLLSALSYRGYQSLTDRLAVADAQQTLTATGVTQHARFSERGSFTSSATELSKYVPDTQFSSGPSTSKRDVAVSTSPVDGLAAFLVVARSGTLCLGLIGFAPEFDDSFETFGFELGSGEDCTLAGALTRRGEGQW